MFTDQDYRIVILLGNVTVAFEKSRIYADSVVLWWDYTDSQQFQNVLRSKRKGDFRYDYLTPDIRLGPFLYGEDAMGSFAAGGTAGLPSGPPAEFYAEGNVRIVQEDASFFCERMYSNLKENRGILVKGEFFGTGELRGRAQPLHFRADSIRKLCEELYVMDNAGFTTCLYGVPHYEVRVSRARLVGDPKDGILSLEDAYFDNPFLTIPMPDASIQIGRERYFPVKSVKAGNSSRFGPHLIVVLEEEYDSLGQALHSALGVNRPFSGDVEFELDLYSKRGLGLGPELMYESPGFYKGYLKGYYINDNEDEDQGGRPIKENKRGRIRTQNRFNVDENTLLDLELSYITDRGFLDEYYEKEFKTGKEQETLAYIHNTEGSMGYSLLTRWRLNDFQTQDEYLPQGVWDVLSLPVLGGVDEPPDGFMESLGVFYSHRAEASQVRNRPDDALNVPSYRVLRGDYLSTFDAPFKLSALKVTPFYENRLSLFSRTDDDESSVGRAVESFGVRSGFLMHARSEYQNEFLMIDGLRNILEPSIQYKNNFAISRESNELIQFDEMEEPSRGDEISLNLRQRLQTRKPQDKTDTHTLYDGLFRLPIYPDERLSTNGHTKGNLNFDLIFSPLFIKKPLKNLRVYEKGEFNLDKKRLENITSQLTLRPHEDFALNIWHNWIRSTQDYLGWSARTLLTPKWEVEVGFEYDLHLHRWAERRLTFRRRAHQWIFEFTGEVDKGDDDKSFTISITPLAFVSDKQEGSIFDPMLFD